jgi:hypothetical protein
MRYEGQRFFNLRTWEPPLCSLTMKDVNRQLRCVPESNDVKTSTSDHFDPIAILKITAWIDLTKRCLE